MTTKQLVSIMVLAAALTLGVVVAVDWSPVAVQDPARTIGLNAQGVMRWGEQPQRPPFSVAELVMFILVGLAFVAAGLSAWRTRPSRSPGALLVAAGMLWIASGFRLSSNPLAFTVGVALTLMYQPPLLQLALSFPSGILHTRTEKWFVGLFYGSWAVVAVTGWAFFDPRLHVVHGQSTSRNLMLLWDSPELTNSLGNANRAFQIGVGLAIVAILLFRWRSGTRAYRIAFLPLWFAALIKTASSIWVSLTVVQLSGTLTALILLSQYPATAIVPIAVLTGLWRYRFARGSLSELMVEIGAAPVGKRLIRALRKAVHDPTLALWQWSPALEGFIDGEGRLQTLPDGENGRAAMVLERHGTPIGALVFDETLRDQPQLLAAVRSATSLTLENRQMEQQLRDQLIQVRQSRERLVTASDARRKQLERDLHDGAQQRLVSVAMVLTQAQRTGDPQRMRDLIGQAGTELNAALAELRELARGVYPPVLREEGIPGALTSLAERTRLPIDIDARMHARLPQSIELAAYFIAAESVTNAVKHARAASIRIQVTSNERELTMKVIDDGCGGAVAGPDGGLLGLADRAAALGGSLEVHSPDGQGTTVRATLPVPAGDEEAGP